MTDQDIEQLRAVVRQIKRLAHDCEDLEVGALIDDQCDELERVLRAIEVDRVRVELGQVST